MLLYSLLWGASNTRMPLLSRQDAALQGFTIGDLNGRLLTTNTGNLPFRRIFLYHASLAVFAMKQARKLRDDPELEAANWEIRSDVPQSPPFQAWLNDALWQGGMCHKRGRSAAKAHFRDCHSL